MAIIGGGLLGLEVADALNYRGAKVTVIQRSARLMGRQLDATAARYPHRTPALPGHYRFAESSSARIYQR